jgi:hypothetical protein
MRTAERFQLTLSMGIELRNEDRTRNRCPMCKNRPRMSRGHSNHFIDAPQQAALEIVMMT